jgi:tetratricopeptide (TPR) repeat protein
MSGLRLRQPVRLGMHNETDNSFTYTLTPRDLDYWMEASGPVLLIVSRPAANEAYWLSVKDFFAEPSRRESHRAEFDKLANVFTQATSPELFTVFRRAEARKALVAQSLVQGPFVALGLENDLARAEAAEQRGDHMAALAAWLELADKVEFRLPRSFVWPLLERAATASQSLGRRQKAVGIYMRLARERLAEDDPSANFDVHRALWAGAPETDFELVVLSLRADTAERGVEILDDLRALHRHAKGARQRRVAVEALVDALVLFGYWEEVVRVVDSVPLKRLDTNEKRGLVMDRCDAGGELGLGVEADWARVVKSAGDAGPQPLGQALQRRAVYLARRGHVADARSLFRQAADVWALKVEGASDQAAEALFSAEEVVRLNGQRAEELPYGTRSVAAFTRGAAQVAAVRGDRLALSGLAQLADKQYAEAIKHLTLGVMVERRAGDLFGLSRMLVFLGRAYEAADEPAEALRWWVRAGDTMRVEPAASKVTFSQGRAVLRLTGSAKWEQAASFAALAVWANKKLSENSWRGRIM